MKIIDFKLKLTFSDDVNIDDLERIMDNVKNGIINEASHGMGISPEDAEYTTEEVELSHINVTNRVRQRVY